MEPALWAPVLLAQTGHTYSPFVRSATVHCMERCRVGALNPLSPTPHLLASGFHRNFQQFPRVTWVSG